MNLLRLSWKNIAYKPLSTLLSILLFALGIGLISLMLLLQKQLQDNFEKNLAGVDLVIGAKGSPLQLILSSMYHIDAPTGNISLAEARPFLNPRHPLIGEAVPLAMGDSHQGYRIVGTTPNILDWYGASLAEGRLWERNFEVTIGAQVADALGLQLGDTFRSSHGFTNDEGMDLEHDDSFKVIGILAASGTVLDQLILTTPQSFWLVHEHEAGPAAMPAEETHDHAEGDEEDDHTHPDEAETAVAHSHDEIPKPLLEEDPEREITSLLLKFKARNYQALNMQRNINENTDLQAATPAIEINRLFSLLSTGEQVLRVLAIVIVFVSGLSIFISLFSSLRERRYELALMRVMGSGRGRVFLLIILEGVLLAIIGYVLGILLSHGGMQLVAGQMAESFRYQLDAWSFLREEGFLLIGALLIGFLASVLPALQASNTDIAETLTQG
ncbi:MAG: ABC transporter permease [Lewinella sp.]|nr:ABC transporter permease [Lewinella sp.]